LIVGIFVKLKAARSRNPGDKKTAQAGVAPSHAPDAESGQYRNDSERCNNIFARMELRAATGLRPVPAMSWRCADGRRAVAATAGIQIDFRFISLISVLSE